ncbi:MAG: hypothetical protein Q4E64_09855 [Phascolarctobacterium sp.]|uniref:hypothetical protein n=1 Tax=Phascolarctobacterium sp. TaxID=2049039 RepID=UPI0026DCAA71|nr:hypothetical protein [Phascolarctobacterium sp.]MDO4922110.1 hypothetical protein [Phascolarctobacterium sp.]
MKKFVILLTTLLTLAGSSLCLAADGGDLNKQQKAVEVVIDALDGEPIPAYSSLLPLISKSLDQNMGEKGFAALQKAVQDRFGILKEAKFFAFQRFDQADSITYIGSFSKENVVTMQFIFDKKNKMTDLTLAPYKAPAQASAQEEKK